MTDYTNALMRAALPALEERARPCRLSLEFTDYGFRLGLGLSWPSDWRHAQVFTPRAALAVRWAKERPLARLWRILRRRPRPQEVIEPTQIEALLITICDFIDSHARAAAVLERAQQGLAAEHAETS